MTAPSGTVSRQAGWPLVGGDAYPLVAFSHVELCALPRIGAQPLQDGAGRFDECECRARGCAPSDKAGPEAEPAAAITHDEREALEGNGQTMSSRTCQTRCSNQIRKGARTLARDGVEDADRPVECLDPRCGPA